jgi:hypothetical protein
LRCWSLELGICFLHFHLNPVLIYFMGENGFHPFFIFPSFHTACFLPLVAIFDSTLLLDLERVFGLDFIPCAHLGFKLSGDRYIWDFLTSVTINFVCVHVCVCVNAFSVDSMSQVQIGLRVLVLTPEAKFLARKLVFCVHSVEVFTKFWETGYDLIVVYFVITVLGDVAQESYIQLQCSRHWDQLPAPHRERKLFCRGSHT